MGIDSEKSIEEQYANWHPEKPEPVPEKENDGLEGLGGVISNPEASLKAGSGSILEFVKKPEVAQSPEAKNRNKARELYEQVAPLMLERVRQIGRLFSERKFDEAMTSAKDLANQAKAQARNFLHDDGDWQEYTKYQNMVQGESDQLKKRSLYKLAMESLDLIPVIGSVKMIGEGLAGTTLSGEKLSTGKRILHFTEGAVFLTLDLTGVGITAAEGMKSGRVITRAAALMRKTGMAREIYAPVYKVGKHLVENPVAAHLADKSFKKIIQARKSRKNNLAERGKEILWNSAETEEQELTLAA